MHTLDDHITIDDHMALDAVPASVLVNVLEHRALRRDARRLLEALATADAEHGRSILWDVITGLPRWFAFVSSCAGAHQRNEDTQLLPHLAEGDEADRRLHEQLLAEHDLNDAAVRRVEEALRVLGDATGDRWVAAHTAATAEAGCWQHHLEHHLSREDRTLFAGAGRRWADVPLPARGVDPLVLAWILDGLDDDERALLRARVPGLPEVTEDIEHRYQRIVRPVAALAVLV